jgi:hypothetical protein
MDTPAGAGYAASWTTEGTSGEKTVTEAEWLTATDPEEMLGFLQDKTSDRKLRLFACACCRAVWDLITDSDAQTAVETAERYAAGLVGDEELRTVIRAIEPKVAYFVDDAGFVAAATSATLWPIAHDGAILAARVIINDIYEGSLGYGDAWQEFADTVRCIFGSPFRSSTLSPAILAWNDAAVVRLAQAAYEERHLPAGTLDNGRLAVLADALEEAGCTDADILGHLRGLGPHVRGCWPVDLCLGKS